MVSDRGMRSPRVGADAENHASNGRWCLSRLWEISDIVDVSQTWEASECRG